MITFFIIKKFLKGKSRLWSNKDYSPPGCEDEVQDRIKKRYTGTSGSEGPLQRP